MKSTNHFVSEIGCRKKPVVSIIGCGMVGTVFGKLLCQSGKYSIGQLYSRRIEQAESARQLIGSGQVVTCFQDVAAADIYCLSVRDDAISSVCDALSNVAQIPAGSVVFHCSGALSALPALQSAKRCGACVGGVHPAFSFAGFEDALLAFRQGDIYCAVEAVDSFLYTELANLVLSIGARPVRIKPDAKLLYHAGLVMASNYLVALVQVGIETLMSVGIDHDQALCLMAPLVKASTAKAVTAGPQQALTGPIARGELQLLAEQCSAVKSLSPKIADLYQQLGACAVDVARQQGILSKSVLDDLQALF